MAGAIGVAAAGAWVGSPSAVAATGGFVEKRLVSDVPGLATLTDPSLKNPWGIAFSSTSPLWVANNGTATATIYTGANGRDPVAKVPLTVNVPGGVTGQVFNTRAASNPNDFPVGGQPAAFLFDGVGGQLSGWYSGQNAVTTKSVPGAVYTGLAEGVIGGQARLFAADAGPAARVDVFDGRYRKVGSYKDPTLPGLAPYNVAVLGGKLYVSFAPPPGSTATPLGAVDVFDLNGTNRRRLVTGGPLNGPWGMVLAPAGWGGFGGSLLVGNEDGGQIHAFNPATGALRGTVRKASGQPFAEDGLWGLAFGNGTFGTPRALIFAAGINGYANGLLGTLVPAGS